ncbi:hypothetical protein L210DRAFT_3609830 [Boletus edulis BED1]|uniref:BTB domain-containing protein n=1 Tax=Boletus edulis BED1 TaxID=1328754 RepID=A0AAD4GIN0_BOLED|nr:hypothetical protein L210DRAFT_3609830 [Boletus edulis BED1]
MNFTSSSCISMNGHTPTNGSTTSIDHPSELTYGDDADVPAVSPVLVSNGYSHSPYQLHNEEIVNHLYHAGFQTGNYADTVLHVHQNSYRLHAIILSRSPFLAHLMSTSPQTGGQRVIYVQLDHEPEVTHEAQIVDNLLALGYLYSSVSINLIRPENARGVLAAGCLLGGMEDLCGYAYGACRQSISVETITEWLEFVDSIPVSPDGSLTPQPPLASLFGEYARRLREDVFQFLVVTLPNTLEIHSSTGSESGSPQGHSGRDTLLQIFSLVPFDMFKAAVESPTFQIGSDQCRFKGIARGHGSEETVVLAFGGGHMSGSTVHVTRKMRKRPLWKVNS